MQVLALGREFQKQKDRPQQGKTKEKYVTFTPMMWKEADEA